MHIERFEYFCPDCDQKGVITDVLLNPELMIIRGRCTKCNLQRAYKVVDMSSLRAEYEALSESTIKEDQRRNKGKDATWSVLRFKVRGCKVA
jgi:hypothetical protein